jgi:septum formation inhibitor MinC
MKCGEATALNMLLDCDSECVETNDLKRKEKQISLEQQQKQHNEMLAKQEEENKKLREQAELKSREETEKQLKLEADKEQRKLEFKQQSLEREQELILRKQAKKDKANSNKDAGPVVDKNAVFAMNVAKGLIVVTFVGCCFLLLQGFGII